MASINSEHPTVAEVVAKLTTKGSADQIAAFFEAEKVTGTPCASFDCPVATYIRGQTGAEIRATPTSIQAAWSRTGTGNHVELNGVGPVAEFMSRFDAGDYPELDDFQREL